MTPMKEEEIRDTTLKNIAQHMMIAARTAPKGRGVDNIDILLIKDPRDITGLRKKMEELAEKHQLPFFKRDANNLQFASAIVIIGTAIEPMGLGKACQMCGFPDCSTKPPTTPCVFNTGDLGIAIGSAVSVASHHHVDNRIMYTIGQAAMELNLFSKDVKIAYGIPLAAAGKNPFFDRK